MLRAFDWFEPKKALPRLAVDFLLVHACMIASLAGCLLFHIAIGNGALASVMIQTLTRYYWQSFLPLSLVFPLTFAMNGFYAKSAGYSNHRKTILVARRVGASVLVFLALNYLVFRMQIAPRSVILLFCVLITLCLSLVRVAKAYVVHHYQTANPQVQGPRANRQILVVGGAGYIGCLLVRRLIEKGYKVRVLDNLMYGDKAIAALHSNPNFELVRGDCRNIQNVVNAVRGVDAIVDLAAIVGDPACEEDRQIALEINFAATRMLIEIAKGYGVQRFIFASSCSVYGATDALMDEQSEVCPISLYAQTKVDSERVLLESRTAQFHPTVLRLATVFGNSWRPRFDLVVNLLVAKAVQEGVITIFNSEQWRPFIHTRDVAEGILTVLEAPLAQISGEVFNLGDSRMNVTLAGLANEIRAQFPGTRLDFRETADRRNYRVSFEKIEHRLGFRNGRTLADGIRELKEAFARGDFQDYTAAEFHNQKFLRASGSPVSANETDARVMAAFAGEAGRL